MKAHVLLITSLLLAGCAADRPNTPDESINEEDPLRGGTQQAHRAVYDPESSPGVNGPFQMDDCLKRTLAFNWPLKMAPGEPPSDWGGDSFQAVTGTFYTYFECHRLNTTGIEAGPIRFLIEAHDKLPYNKCTSDQTALRMTPFRFYAEGEWLVDFFTTAWGVEAIEVSFQRATDNAIPGWALETLEMKVAVSGQLALHSQYAFQTAPENARPAREQYFWTHGDGVQSWNLDMKSTTQPRETPVAWSQFGAPTIMAEHDLRDAVVLGGYYRNMTVTGDLAWIAPGACES